MAKAAAKASETGLLEGKQAISAYLNNASEYMLKKYIKAGMPVLILDGTWLAYKDNIEEFFKKATRVPVTEYPEE